MIPPNKHPDLVVRQWDPFNAEPPAGLLRGSFVTPTDMFYVRNHGTIPSIDPVHYRLSAAGMVNRPLSLSLDDIRTGFPRVTLAATLECAGNRRDELMAMAPIPGEVAWGAEAISTAVWGGVLLRDVLRAAGVQTEARHVALEGLDDVEKQGRRFGFGGSIPLDKALGDEVLLVYEMNGEPLTPIHGFPLRAIVPGYIGARSVKWLSRVTLQGEPSANYFQAHAYKLFPPGVTPETADWSQGRMLGELAVNAAISTPRQGEALPAGPIVVEGYAIAGGGCRVARVEVSPDRGATWMEAELGTEDGPWTWCFWQARLELGPGAHQLVVRAWDSDGNTQPEDARSIWNFKGYLNNAWHRVSLSVR